MEQFNIEKLIQIVGYLIKKYKKEGKVNYTKLIKEIYLADREALKNTGYSISTDTYCSMRCGPVFSTLYDLIMQKSNNPANQILWNSKFARDNYDLHLVCSFISDNELSSYDMEVLDRIDSKYHNKDYGFLIDYTHKNCSEWVDTDSSIPISIEKLLKAIGYSDEQIEYNIEEKSYYVAEKNLIDKIPDELPEDCHRGVVCG